jgi:predicted nucleotidyltransferase
LPTIAELIVYLQRNYKPKDVVCYQLWTTEDIVDVARENGWSITKPIAEATLEVMDKKWDAGIGLNWDVIEVYVHEAMESARQALEIQLPQVLSVEQFDQLVTKSKAFTDTDYACSSEVVQKKVSRYAERHIGVIYTQVDGKPDGSEHDVFYEKGFAVVNRTGRYEVVIQTTKKAGEIQ